MVIMVTAVLLDAQPIAAQGVGFGVKGGPTFSTFDAARTDFTSNTGLQGGMFFGGNRPGRVGVMGDILYARKTSTVGSRTTDLHFLEIPILLRLNAGSSSRNRVNVYGIGGPAFDINLKARQNGFDVKDNFESLDLGVIAGGGIEITRLIIEARYNWGLRNVLKASGGASSDLKTRSFALMAGLRFN